MAPEIDLDAFRDMARDWTRLDFAAYAQTFAHRRRSRRQRSAAEDRDADADRRRRPRSADPAAHGAAHGRASCRDAELALVDDATHFGLLEQPAAITEHAARFLRDRLDLDV